MKNRGVKVVGFNSAEELQEAINLLDVEHLSELATLKGFTVRDVENMIIEMAAHAYYYKVSGGKDGLAWTNANFVEVIEHSEGCVKENGTGELILGDRWLFQKSSEKNIKDENKTIINPTKFDNGFQEK
jgi:hypothetical protein